MTRIRAFCLILPQIEPSKIKTGTREESLEARQREGLGISVPELQIVRKPVQADSSTSRCVLCVIDGNGSSMRRLVDTCTREVPLASSELRRLSMRTSATSCQLRVQ